MSYCRKEGKDIIIFATEEDLAGPSKVTLLPDDPSETDSSHQGAILPNGDINWDCPCLGNLPNGPCGPMFRESFTCWVDTRDDQEEFAENCFEHFSKWEDCLSEHRDIYKTEKKDEGRRDDSGVDSAFTTEIPEMIDSKENELNNSSDLVSSVDKRPAIAAAYVEETSTEKSDID